MSLELNEVSDLSEDSLFGEDLLDFDLDMFDLLDANSTESSTTSTPLQGSAVSPIGS